jgi:hypothetical protein
MGSILKCSNFVRNTLLSLVLVLIGTVSLSRAQTQQHKTFASSRDAIDAFVHAVRENNRDELLSILGPESEQIVSSGDDVADKQARDRFISEYKVKHSLKKDSPQQFTLSVGNNDWPLPIPLIHANGAWYWDGAAGREELLYRRIGHNELSAIKVCQGILAAQREYASRSHGGRPAGVYASRIVSASGTQDGLYWEARPGAPPSPAGPLLAKADAEDRDSRGHAPYHGYYYRMLRDPGGFGFVAFPAEYRASGVMTFIVNHTGTIYQKDLGANTTEIGQHMTDYYRDDTWKRVK